MTALVSKLLITMIPIDCKITKFSLCLYEFTHFFCALTGTTQHFFCCSSVAPVHSPRDHIHSNHPLSPTPSLTSTWYGGALSHSSTSPWAQLHNVDNLLPYIHHLHIRINIFTQEAHTQSLSLVDALTGVRNIMLLDHGGNGTGQGTAAIEFVRFTDMIE